MKKLIYLILIPLLFACSSSGKIRFVRVGKFKPAETMKMTEKVQNSYQSKVGNDKVFGLPEAISPSDEIDNRNVSQTNLIEGITHFDQVNDAKDQALASKSPLKEVEVKKKSKAFISSDQKSGKKRQKGDLGTWFLLFGGIAGVLLGFGVVRNKKKAVHISNWAKNNKWKSIGLIVLIKMSLAAAGLYAGKMMFDSGLYMSSATNYSLLSVAGLAALSYPKRKAISGFFKHSYLRQKMHDLVLALTGVMLMVSMGNQLPQNPTMLAPINKVFFSGDTVERNVSAQKGIQNASTFTGEYSEPTISLKSSESEKSTGIQVLLTILSVLVALALLVLLLVLVCSLSCGGQEAFAAAAAIGGLLLIILLLVLVIRAIWKNNENATTQIAD
ncbi:MAG: hypothetical protein AB8B56_15525 [Crocinitomicaceae bacterium]